MFVKIAFVSVGFDGDRLRAKGSVRLNPAAVWRRRLRPHDTSRERRDSAMKGEIAYGRHFVGNGRGITSTSEECFIAGARTRAEQTDTIRKRYK